MRPSGGESDRREHHVLRTPAAVTAVPVLTDGNKTILLTYNINDMYRRGSPNRGDSPFQLVQWIAEGHLIEGTPPFN